MIRFINPLLDAVVDRFGNEKGSIWYEKLDDGHFTVSAPVEISNQFFGWVLGFGNRAKILEPPAVVDQFAAYLDKVREMYESSSKDVKKKQESCMSLASFLF